MMDGLGWRIGAVAAMLLIAGAVHSGAREAGAHALSGAIWTSLANGEQVDGNVYPSPQGSFTQCDAALTGVGLPTASNAKDCVFLNGGPVREGAAGLPPTDPADPGSIYVFQVTDPAGKVLLSNDPARCRQFTVGSNGRIDGVVSQGDNCHHKVGLDSETGAVTIQLNRAVSNGGNKFDDTPNNGGEYKVWVTRVGDFLALGGDLNCNPKNGNGAATCRQKNLDGFQGGHIKTDNFKVRGRNLGAITGVKYYDANNNGDRDGDPLEAGIAGWPIKACKTASGNGNGGSIPNVGDCAETVTGTNGEWAFVNLGAGTYCIREALARDIDSDPLDPQFNSIDWKQTEPTSPATSVLYASGCNTNGTFDDDAMNGVYSVVISGNVVGDRDFGNVAFERVPFEGGLTWGYWKTHTGTESSPGGESGGPPQDPVYEGLASGPIQLGTTPNFEVDSPEDADIVFAADGTSLGALCQPSPGDCREGDFSPPADCGGDCNELLAAQLLALKLNVRKFSGMGDAIYINPGDPFSGFTVNAIIQMADFALSTWMTGGSVDLGTVRAAVNAINENESTPVLFTWALLPAPPAPLCFVSPAVCVP
jgi:hypothetical protein